MLVFLLAQIPFPIIMFLNWRVTMRFWRVHKLSAHTPVEKPARLIIGWWLNNVAMIFALIPSAVEWRIFVQDHRWLVCYGLSATLTIIGLLLMNSGLGTLSRRRFRKSRREPVDTRVPDTL
jgi:hypothetical protein